jgi:Histidine kinase-, DNA gyrase B-, and HSP90-like ATPase
MFGGNNLEKLMEIVPAHLAVKAMRDNGYKNAAYAVAELMDNSIQAMATKVELICMEKIEFLNQRNRSQIFKIGVLDNGVGMDDVVLRKSLQFGNGMNLEEAAQTGMGKFGMGLPASSVSQARKVEVWTWQDGVESAIYSYLDIDLIGQQKQKEVPEPVSKKVPKEWLKAGSEFSAHGTLVVWSTIDRCIWKTGRAVIDNSELIIGRMYRKFLSSGKIEIRMATFDWDNVAGGASNERIAVPNDPLYLICPSSTDAPYDQEAMFEPWPAQEGFENVITVRFRGRDHKVYIRTSMAKKSAREGGTAGARAYGRHAQKNMGVSVVRAKRELELDPNWAMQGDPRERWWGVEVEFSPGLDELFGVTNNKQSARNFAEWAHIKVDDLLVGGKTITALKDDLAQDEDPSGPLLEVAHYVQNSVEQMRKLIHAQMKRQRTGEKQRHGGGFEAEREATQKTRERQLEGKVGESDAGETKSEVERMHAIEKALEEQGIDQAAAMALAATTVSDSLKYVFAEASLDSPAFFSVQPKGGAIIITLNTEHGAYNRLVDVLEQDPANASDENLVDRLNNALEGLKLLLMAWARYEDEQGTGQARERAQDARVDWGRIARRFLDRRA